MTSTSKYGRRAAAAAALLLALSGCANTISPGPTTHEVTPTATLLHSVPAPQRPVVVAVYTYPDQTGQFQATSTVATFSHAVSQGATTILIKALQDAGNGQWFTVVEREHLNNLITERQIIRQERQAYKTADGRQLGPLPPMLYAGVLLEGGVIGYDTNTLTGGLGANYLGIGANVQYQEDTVTVYLRAVSTETGQVLGSVMVKKKILSYGLQGNIFKFVAFEKLLQGETGFTANEPGLLCLRQAIEKAVVALVVQGAEKKLWAFGDAAAGQKFLDRWRKDEESYPPSSQTAMAAAAQAPAQVVPR